MATFYLPILNWTSTPGSSGEAFFEPYSVKASNDRWDSTVAVFNNAGSPIEIFGTFRVPENYVGSASVAAPWTSTATTGSCVYRFHYRAVAVTESLDQTGQDESASIADESPSAVNLRQDAVIGLTEGNFAAGDLVQYEFMRDPTDGADDLAAAVTVHGVYFAYQDS